MAKYREEVLEVAEVNFPQKGIALLEGERVHFKGGLPGQFLRLGIKKKRGQYEGKIIQLEKKSPLETEKGCSAFGRCGGCVYQSLPYETEGKLIAEQLFRLYSAEFPEIENLPVIFHPSPKISSYRNKMEYTFGDEEKGGPLVLGLHEKNRFYSILDTKGCTIASPDFERIRQSVSDYFRKRGTSFYHKMSKEGYLRHLMLRMGGNTGEILVNLYTTTQGELQEEEFVQMLLNLPLEGKITGILHTHYDGLSDKTAADEEKVLYGRREFQDRLLGLTFNVSPYSFFQTNSKAAELLYSRVLDFAGEIQGERVYDLYSGTGTIAQIFALKADFVQAVEIVPEAVETAKENAKRNGLTNIQFHTGDVMEFLKSLEGQPDVVIIDPPREGIHPKSIEGILSYAPKRFVYVSCNPITHVRDLKIFKIWGYKIARLEFVDMFPRTANCEALTLLVKESYEGKAL